MARKQWSSRVTKPPRQRKRKVWLSTRVGRYRVGGSMSPLAAFLLAAVTADGGKFVGHWLIALGMVIGGLFAFSWVLNLLASWGIVI